MKTNSILLYLTIALFTNGCAFAQASRWSHPWTATIKVVGEDMNPISGAEVAVSYTIPPPPGRNPEEGSDWGQIKGFTDTNGMFSASHTDSSWGLGINVEKVGFYTTHIGHELRVPGQSDEKTVQTSRNPVFTLVIKKVGQPTAMYAKRLNLGMPVFDKPAGFDLMAGDWVAPYGKGSSSDLIFTAHKDLRSEFDWDYKLTVGFPNAGDGIQEFKVTNPEKGSALRSAHDAPSDGYLAQWVQTRSARPQRGGYSGNLDANRNYYFRARTVLDEHGNVKSALYGKIYGDFLEFTYYLNPNPNDHNVEFDPKKNLLHGLKGTEEVNAP